MPDEHWRERRVIRESFNIVPVRQESSDEYFEIWVKPTPCSDFIMEGWQSTYAGEESIREIYKQQHPQGEVKFFKVIKTFVTERTEV